MVCRGVRMTFKRASVTNQFLLIALIGVVLIGISFPLIGGVFTEEEADWETCRDSINLRDALPAIKFESLSLKDFKENYPLQCKTSVVDISLDDLEKDLAEKKIAESILQCWALFGNGDKNPFPVETLSKSSVCVPCARIHLTEEARLAMIEDPELKINIFEGLSENGFDDESYLRHLNYDGKAYSAFDMASARPFNLQGKIFQVDESNSVDTRFRNRETGASEKLENLFGMEFKMEVNGVELPEYMNPLDGDLIINYGNFNFEHDDLEYVPYIFYFQLGQTPNPYSETSDRLYVGGGISSNAYFCEYWEGAAA